MPRFKLLLSLSSALLLISCAHQLPSKTPTPSVATETETPDQVDKVCTVIHPIYYSRHDTAGTVTQVQQLNAGIVALCPQYRPKAKP